MPLTWTVVAGKAGRPDAPLPPMAVPRRCCPGTHGRPERAACELVVGCREGHARVDRRQLPVPASSVQIRLIPRSAVHFVP